MDLMATYRVQIGMKSGKVFQCSVEGEDNLRALNTVRILLSSDKLIILGNEESDIVRFACFKAEDIEYFEIDADVLPKEPYYPLNPTPSDAIRFIQDDLTQGEREEIQKRFK